MQCVYMPGLMLTTVWQPIPVLDQNTCSGPDAGVAVVDDGVPCVDRPTMPCNLTGITDSPQLELNHQMAAAWHPPFSPVEIDFENGCATSVVGTFYGTPGIPSQITSWRWACAIGLSCAQIPGGPVVE
jgi:hypothetical protein